jgi:DNA polymerase III epsilon subunit-like protein
MIDFETLGTNADSVIMSIGAVKFDLNSDRMDDAGFYASISIESNLAAGRQLNEDTLLWWLRQTDAAQEVFFEPKQELSAALDSFSEWWASSHSSTRIWSNGADFDIPMLSHAYRHYGWDTPWEFYNSRCVRTYKSLPGVKGITVPNTQKHNALSDAIAQVRLVQAIQKKISAGHPMVKAP